MKLYLTRKNSPINACAEYDIANKSFVVLKGSKVSDTIAHSATFRGSKSIEKQRSNGTVIDGVVMENVFFKSPSTAANFVTGASTNGMIVWKDANGISLKVLLSKREHNE